MSLALALPLAAGSAWPVRVPWGSPATGQPPSEPGQNPPPAPPSEAPKDQPPVPVPSPTPPRPTPPPAQPETKPPAPIPPAPGAEPRETEPEIVVFLKDGKRFNGLLVSEKEGTLVLRIAGIATRFDAATVDRYQILPPVLERYRQIRDAVGDDVAGLLQLVDWLRAREQYDLALKEVRHVLEIDANSGEALRLKTLLTSQIELRNKAKSGPQKPTSAQPVRPASESKPTDPHAQFPLLTEQQINLIKVYEVDLDDPPRILIRRDTVTRLLQFGAGSPQVPVTQEGRDAIYREPPSKILELMFRLKARDLYGEVQVIDQPKAMQIFRDDVCASWLMNSCATNACHGGQEAGRLMLCNRRPRAEASVYTNFLILDRFKLADGAPLINYDAPDRSPLLQMGLPREDSLFPHPVIRKGASAMDGWKRVFKSTDERQFKRTEDWIKGMYRPRPTYPIEYQPPSGAGSIRPADKADPLPR